MGTSISRLAELVGTVRGRRSLLAIAGAAAVLGALLLLASRSSLFHVRHLEVTGASNLSRTEIVRLAAISPSTNVLWFDRSAVERRLEADPWVARAAVSSVPPSTIRIAVVERHPVASVPYGSGYLLVAGDGTTLGTVQVDPGLPTISVPTGPSTGRASPDYAGPARAIAGLDAGIPSRVVQALVAPDGTLTVDLSSGTRVEYGSTTQVEAKTAAVRRILWWARRHGTSLLRINVSAANAPAATPA